MPPSSSLTKPGSMGEIDEVAVQGIGREQARGQFEKRECPEGIDGRQMSGSAAQRVATPGTIEFRAIGIREVRRVDRFFAAVSVNAEHGTGHPVEAVILQEFPCSENLSAGHLGGRLNFLHLAGIIGLEQLGTDETPGKESPAWEDLRDAFGFRSIPSRASDEKVTTRIAGRPASDLGAIVGAGVAQLNREIAFGWHGGHRDHNRFRPQVHACEGIRSVRVRPLAGLVLRSEDARGIGQAAPRSLVPGASRIHKAEE